MNMKKLLLLLVVLFASFNIFAHGKGDVDEKSVVNLNSWQEEFDLEGKTQAKASKYNIMITATDLGGNQYIEGPFNIYVDPDSDIPLPGITNPTKGMRVVGNLNIVGTCVDDDGVSKVELILDKGKHDEEGNSIEKTVVAEGTEFWSYYLDTTDMAEGSHTIEVRAYDINGTPGPKNPEKNPVSVEWQLDRRQPATALTEFKDKANTRRDDEVQMGLLVSGNVNFKGVVTDGNGIEELRYSTDKGKTFEIAKLNKKNEFDFSVDSRKYDDGPAVVWFRAKDKAGSIGLYSFLFFVDNTKPDISIVYPTNEVVENGKFSVAGYAKDTNGIKDNVLTWTFGTQSGEIPMIPGNPYWSVNVDSIGAVKEKSRKFIISGTDNAGNTVEKVINIPLNQENDKPVVTIEQPVNGQIYNGDDENLFVRGFVTDDDSVQSVKVQLDATEPVIQETKGSFYVSYGACSGLNVGNHKITVTGIDENGVEGNPVTVQIISKGAVPSFEAPLLVSGKEFVEYVDGTEINPEAGNSFEIKAVSELGLKEVRTEIIWGKNGSMEMTSGLLKNLPSYKVSVPVKPDFPKGIVQVLVTAIDSSDRMSEYKSFLYVKNTSVIKSDKIQVVFNDSTVADDGSVISNADFPVTGYVLGGEIAKVEIVPESDFIKRVEVKGNQIKLIPNMSKVGGSKNPSVVRVTTENGKVAESRPLYFKNDTALPVIKINNYSESAAVRVLDGEGNVKPLSISGTITCETGVGAVSYAIHGIETPVDPKTGLINKPNPVRKGFMTGDVTCADDGKFTLNVDTASLGDGVYLVEIVAESAGGNKVAKTVAVDKIPAIPEPEEGKKPAVAKPAVTSWVDSLDVYAVVTSQIAENVAFQTFARSEMKEGANPLTYGTAKYSANKNPTLQANFALVDGNTYFSGMPVTLAYGPAKTGSTVTVYIDTGAAVSSVSYEITGDEVAGGDQRQAGSAKLTKPTVDNPSRWIAEIPLINLPVRENRISVKIRAGSLEQTIVGYVCVVREKDSANQDDDEKIYELPALETVNDKAAGSWILKNGSAYSYYANYHKPVSAELSCEKEGLALKLEGKMATITAVKEGVYENVKVLFTDAFGDVYETVPKTFVADSTKPVLVIQTPVLHQWLDNTVVISGTAQDDLGVKAVEYSLDNGQTWNDFVLTGDKDKIAVTFSQSVDISKLNDGLVQIDLRAYDVTDHVTYARTAAYKDVTAPVVTVIEPLEDDVVNGQTLVVFQAKDNGWFNKVEYVRGEVRKEIEINPLVSTVVGTEEMPIENDMSFLFTDAAGNTTTLSAWQFLIDNASDLPVAEIHVPEENEVLTPQSSDYFTISGVIYDDDGKSEIYYKIDDGEYKKYPELSSSYSVDVPFSIMTDNEHSVTVYAVDLNGVKGNEVTRNFRISLEEPKGEVVTPTIDVSVRGVVTISGVASDKNGIKKVEVSLDNGNSYNDATGQEEWSYEVDSRAIPGGTSAIFLRVTDNYDIRGLYSSLINIDNEAPRISLDLPLDDSISTGDLFFSGYAFDNVELSKMYATIRNMDKSGAPVIRELGISDIIAESMDIRDLEDGLYNVEISGEDRAGNKTNVSRNIHLEKNRPASVIDVLYPLNGEHKNGKFNIYGQAETNQDLTIEKLILYIDGKQIKETQLSSSGFFKFEINPPKSIATDEIDEEGHTVYRVEKEIDDGRHTYRVDAVLSNGVQVPSRELELTYSAYGPWISIDTLGSEVFTYGDFAMKRPFLRGTAGYNLNPEEVLKAKAKDASKFAKEELAAKTLSKVEISFDNGKNFTLLSQKGNWEYRIENEDMTEGYHFLMLRATMANGESAIERTIIQIDNTAPTIKLISPENGGRYNQVLGVSGLSKDDVGLESVVVSLRKGDKSAYEVPSFIQGLYVDLHFFGSTLYDIGAGLTFFDDNVKLQFQWGQFTQTQRDAISKLRGAPLTEMRYGGDSVMGAKLLANIANIPFSYFLGRDWEWLSANFTVGAQFTRFNQTNSGRPQILSAVLVQLEFPRVHFEEWSMFKTFAFYSEFSAWFIPSDVSNDSIKNLIPQFGFGLRTNIF